MEGTTLDSVLNVANGAFETLTWKCMQTGYKENRGVLAAAKASMHRMMADTKDPATIRYLHGAASIRHYTNACMQQFGFSYMCVCMRN